VRIQAWWRMVRARRKFVRYRALRSRVLGRDALAALSVWVVQVFFLYFFLFLLFINH
jgi:hypothetical protein